jgi:putative flippase GtrA
VPQRRPCRNLGLVPAPQQQKPTPSGHPHANPQALDLPSALATAAEPAGSLAALAQPEPEPAGTGLVRGLINRFEHLIHEVGKFGTVGLVAFAVDAGMFNLLLGPLDPLPAKAIATVISASVAFVGNRFWTWRHRPRSGLGREYGLYFLFNGVGLGIGLACLWLSHYGLGAAWPALFQTRLADNLSSLGVGMVLGTIFRFWAYRRIVFRAPAERPPAGASSKAPS